MPGDGRRAVRTPTLDDVFLQLAGNRIARVMFCIADGQLVLLHGFIKKSRKTPPPDLDLARARQKEVEQ